MIVVGEDIEEAFSRLEMLERIARISLEVSSELRPPVEASVPQESLIYTQTCPEYENDYQELDTFAKRVYNQVGDC